MAKYNFSKGFEERFITTCLNAASMGQAALELKMNYKTVRFHALRLGCFKKNQPGKGRHKAFSGQNISLAEIFAGTPYQSHKLKRRLLTEGYKSHKCENCHFTDW